MKRAPQAPESTSTDPDDLGGVALFFDVENILLGLQGDLDVGAVSRFLGERGEVMILRAYADWGRYRRQQRHFLDEGVQMVFLPTYGASDKNRTDTAICVDAMEILYTRPHIDTFCIVSGDSDFGVLAQRLRDHGKRVIGVSARSAASPVLVKQCHEFAFYETLVGQRVAGFSVEEGEERVKRALERVVEEEGHEFRAGVLKDRMRKQDPTFSERNYGASSFTRFLGNYDHLLTVGEGGMVRVVPRVEAPPASMSRAGRSERDKALEGARAVLLRTVIEAGSRHGAGPVSLSRLKDTMQAVAPDFDEVSVGYRTFTAFLLAFPDIVGVDRGTNTARPADGIIPPPPEDETAGPDGSAGSSERRRRPRKPREAPASAASPEPGVETITTSAKSAGGLLTGPEAPTAALPAEKTADTKPEKTADTKPDKTADTKPDKTADTKPEKTADTKPDKTADTKPEKTADTKPEKTADTKPDKTADTKADKPDTKADKPADTKADKPADAKADKPDAKPEKADRDARMKPPGLPGLDP